MWKLNNLSPHFSGLFLLLKTPFIAFRMWASGFNYPTPGEAEKRVCAALGFERATANGAAFQFNP
jgi:hypothetical protein